MQQRLFQTFRASRGVSVTTTASTSQSATIPLDSSGNVPRYLRFCATGTVFVRTNRGSFTATTGDVMVPAGDPVILKVGTDTHYGVIDNGATAVVNIIPLEDS